MPQDSEFAEAADACVKAAELVNQIGSPALQQAMRVVLYILGTELAQRAKAGAHPGQSFAHIIGKRSA